MEEDVGGELVLLRVGLVGLRVQDHGEDVRQELERRQSQGVVELHHSGGDAMNVDDGEESQHLHYHPDVPDPGLDLGGGTDGGSEGQSAEEVEGGHHRCSHRTEPINSDTEFLWQYC